MKNFLFFFSFLLSAQQPICHITDFIQTSAPILVRSISLGAYSTNVERCTFWFNSPSPTQIQHACYEPGNPIPVDNSIKNLTNAKAATGSWNFQDGNIDWLIKAGEYHFVGRGSDGIEVKEDGTF